MSFGVVLNTNLLLVGYLIGDFTISCFSRITQLIDSSTVSNLQVGIFIKFLLAQKAIPLNEVVSAN